MKLALILKMAYTALSMEKKNVNIFLKKSLNLFTYLYRRRPFQLFQNEIRLLISEI